MGTYFPVPCSPFEKINIKGDSITLNTTGKILVLPTGDSSKLPSYNEYTLNSNRLTTAESPFGGLKGTGASDYSVGTLYTPTTGILLKDKDGNNGSQTLTAGVLKSASCLTVDTSAKSISEEFIIENTNTANGTPLPIDDCNSVTPSWTLVTGSAFSVAGDGSKVTITVTTDGTGLAVFNETIASKNLTNYPFIVSQMRSSHAGSVYIGIGSGSSNYVRWLDKNCTSIVANTDSTYVLPLKAPLDATVTNSNPNGNSNPTWSAITYLRFGFKASAYPNTQVTITLYDISADVGKTAYVEMHVPDNLTDYSQLFYIYNGGTSTYETLGTFKLDQVYGYVTGTSTGNYVFLDSTKLDDVFGTTQGRARFIKGKSGDTVSGSGGTMTYSTNKGTKYRLGYKFDLPPASTANPNFTKIRIKTVTNYTDVNGNTIQDLSGNGRPLTIYGNPIKTSSGISFDGVIDRAEISISNLPDRISTFEVETNFKVTSNTANMNIIGLRNGSIYEPFRLEIISNRTSVALWVAESGANKDSGVYPVNLSDGNFHTLKITYSGINQLTVLCDGVPVNPSAALDGMTTTLSPLTSICLGSRGTLGNYAECVIKYAKIKVNGSIIAEYLPTSLNNGTTTYEFEDSTNSSYGLQNLSKPWIALLDYPSYILEDLSTSENRGIITGAVNVSGRNSANRSLKFNGTSNKVTFATNTNLTNFTAKSVFMWVKNPAVTAGRKYIYDGCYDTSTFGDSFQNSGSSNGCYIYVKNSSGTLASKLVTFTVDTWVLLGYTWDGINVLYYKNGVQFDTAVALTGTLSCSAYLPAFGFCAASNNQYFNGSLGEVRIYNRCLTPQECADLYNDVAVSATGLLGKWNPPAYNPEIEFYLFTHRPKNLIRKRDDSGTIHEVTLYPGNGSIFRGRITYADLTTDANTNLIPNCLESEIEGSITKFLSQYGMIV